jgi:hypothetical protein
VTAFIVAGLLLHTVAKQDLGLVHRVVFYLTLLLYRHVLVLGLGRFDDAGLRLLVR